MRWSVTSMTCILLGFSATAAEEVLKRFGETPAPALREPFQRFELRPGETVVFMGQANLVREQKAAELESRLAMRFASSRPRFRSMAWEGDTVYEQWRDLNFGSWTQQLAYAGATVVMMQFGQMEALEGVERIPEFKAAYGRLLDQVTAHTTRVVLISPMPFESPGPARYPDLSGRNVQAYVDAIRQVALERGMPFIDLFGVISAGRSQAGRLTENGVHLSEAGLAKVAEWIVTGLGLPPVPAPGLTLRQAIVEKNRLWFDVWRPMNWAFAYGDRTHVEFGQPAGQGLWLKEELEQFKPLLAEADARVHALASEEPILTPGTPRAPTGPPGALEDPAEALSRFEVRPGYAVNLFASEREGVVNPIQIAWDEHGRLWVACSPTYPHITPGAPPRDYVLVCEDADRDGVAERSWRFADGLSMVQGLELGDGGLYLASGTELLHLRDNDGDGRADSRRVILSGFGTGDTHQLINSIGYGPDGTLWFTQGLHIFSRVETPWGIARLDKSGVWRLDPRLLRLDPFFNEATAGHNCWGVAFDDYGQVFHKSGDRAEGYYSVPGLIPLQHPAEYHPTGALFRSPTKTTALDFIGTRHLPEELQGTAVLAGFIAGEIEIHRLSDDGAGFKSEQLPRLLRSSSDSFRPVDVSLGPDGAIYVADFHNRMIGHYQTSYRHPDRDKWHGRIWRIATPDRPRVQPPSLARMTPLELFRQLRSDERWTRLQARRLLFNAPTEQIAAALGPWLAEIKTPGRELIDTVGAAQAHGMVRPDLVNRLLAAEDPRLRAYGARLVGAWAQSLTNALDLLAGCVRDPNPRVRLEGAVACAWVNQPKAADIAVEILDHPRDRFIDYALSGVLRALRPFWQTNLFSGQVVFGGRADRLAFVLETGVDPELAGRLRHLLGQEGAISGPARTSLLLALIRGGGPEDLALAFERGAGEPVVLRELAGAARLRQLKPEGDRAERLRPLLSEGPNVAAAALNLCAAWEERSLTQTVRAIAEDPSQPSGVRAAAIQAAGHLEGAAALEWLTRFLDGSPAFLGPTLSALSRIDLAAAAQNTARLMVHAVDETRMGALLAPLLGRSGGTEALAVALGQAQLPPEPARLARRVLAQAGRDDVQLSKVLAQALGAPAATPDYSAEVVQALAGEVRAQGNPVRGRTVYDALGCAQCHILEGQGKSMGPDLTALGRAMPLELIIEAVLWPKRQIKEGYFSTEIETRQGDYIQGFRLDETRDVLSIRDVLSGEERRVRKADILSRQDAGTIMPEGLTDGLARPELVDLLRFLWARESKSPNGQ